MDASALTVVVGAGISGLSCAYALNKSGLNVRLLEASPRPGGVIRSLEDGGYVFELGPQSFSSTDALHDLCDDLGLGEQMVAAPHGAPRYVLIRGRLMTVPFSPPAFFTSGLLDWSSKFKILTEVLRTTRPPEPDESIAAFTRRKFSAQLLERLVAPFVSGIYAGDPEQLSLRAAFPRLYSAERSSGSVVRGMVAAAKKSKPVAKPRRRASLISFRHGNEALVSTLAERVSPALQCNVRVFTIAREGGGFALKMEGAAGGEELHCERVVIAAPTAAAASLLQDLAPEVSASLRQITYSPVAVVSLAYKRSQVGRTLDGFGFLVPRSAGLRTLGVVWNSSLFPGRAPEGCVLLTSFVGGATDPSALELSPNQLSELVHGEITPILAIKDGAVKTQITTYDHAIPQYNVGHTERLQSIQGALAAIPGLWLIGNYWNGPAVGTCIDHALAVADQVRISYNS